MLGSTLRIAFRNLGRSRRRTALALAAIALAQLGVLAMNGIINGRTVWSSLAMQALTPSSLTPEQRLSFVLAHFRHPVQPENLLPASWTSSVSMPAASSSAKTCRTRSAVLPSFA